MEEEKLLDNAAAVGEHLKTALHTALSNELNEGSVREIRGQGLMLGIALHKPCGVLMQRAADAGLLISITADSVVRLIPPLILTIAQADEIVSILCPLISAYLKEST
jgi:acetylornithine aminotransferase